MKRFIVTVLATLLGVILGGLCNKIGFSLAETLSIVLLTAGLAWFLPTPKFLRR